MTVFMSKFALIIRNFATNFKDRKRGEKNWKTEKWLFKGKNRLRIYQNFEYIKNAVGEPLKPISP